MADQYLGQVADEVDTLAAEFEARAVDLEGIRESITAKLAGTTWTGPDRERFQGDWDGPFTQTMQQIVLQLRSASEHATANAQQQREASGA